MRYMIILFNNKFHEICDDHLGSKICDMPQIGSIILNEDNPITMIEFVEDFMFIDLIFDSYGADKRSLKQYFDAQYKAFKLCKFKNINPHVHFLNQTLQGVRKYIDSYENVDSKDIDFYKKIVTNRYNLINKFGRFKYDDNIVKVKWKSLATKTGRMRVDGDINPLTFTDKDKTRIGTIEDGHVLLSCDFKAQEFRAMLDFFGSEYHKEIDPYTKIMSDYGFDNDNRSGFKTAIIAYSYGSRLNNINQLSTIDKGRLSAFFNDHLGGIEEFIEELRDECEDFGFFRNHYGRRVYERDDEMRQSVLINNYFQSVGADLSYIYFNGLAMKLCDVYCDSIYPAYMIHDSICFSVPMDKVETIISEETRVGNYPIEWTLI
jgi:hypothetical protein